MRSLFAALALTLAATPALAQFNPDAVFSRSPNAQQLYDDAAGIRRPYAPPPPPTAYAPPAPSSCMTSFAGKTAYTTCY